MILLRHSRRENVDAADADEFHVQEAAARSIRLRRRRLLANATSDDLDDVLERSCDVAAVAFDVRREHRRVSVSVRIDELAPKDAGAAPQHGRRANAECGMSAASAATGIPVGFAAALDVSGDFCLRPKTKFYSPTRRKFHFEGGK